MSLPPQFSLAKHTPPLTAEQKATLQRLSSLRLSAFNESDVREEFLVPLIGLLGYQRDTDYTVYREESYQLNPLFLTVGSSRIRLDYRFNVYKAGFWLLEAKGAVNPTNAPPPVVTDDMISQAHFYAHHRDIDCSLFGVSNGWWTNLYDRDADEPSKPILSIFYADLPSKFSELYALIGASQVTFAMKRRLLNRIEQVLSADVDMARTEEFIREAQAAARRANPKVLENFRRNARVREGAQSQEFREYLEDSRPYDTLDTLLTWPLNMGSMMVSSDILSRKVAQFAGSNQFLFFHKLLVTETRPVTIDYYINALSLLATMCHKGELSKVDTRGAGQTETPIEDLYFGFVRLVLFHLSPRPDLQVLWAMEGMLKRMAKRALLSSHVARKDIAAGVEMQRYLQPEEKIAYLGPSPARTLIQAVESIALAELGAFFTRHWNKGGNRKFDVRSATEEFQTKRRAFEPLEDATDADYRKLAADLGQEWSELTWSHELNRSWDRLGHAVCEIVLAHRGLLNGLPDDCRSQLIELSRLGNSFARQCLEALGMDVPADYSDAQDRLRAMFRLEAS